jgi:hypothetical protein
MIDLLLFKDNLNTKEINNKQYVYDPLRNKHVVLTPEELVRQLIITYLLNEKKIPSKYIAVEKQIDFNSKPVRFDVLIFNKNAIPKMIIECKSFKTTISDIAGLQISKYNTILKAEFLCITNGISTRVFQTDIANNEIIELMEFPEMV